MKKAIFLLAALVALLGSLTVGWEGGLIWLVAVLAALIMVRKSWSKKSDEKPE
jgi:hypothetical protein